MTKLTEHFTVEELSRSEAATRRGLDNTPPADLLSNMLRVARALETVRAHYGAPLRITSCYRSPAVNLAVGGSLTSAHRFALAADFEVEGVANIEVCRWIQKNLPDFDQVIYEFGPAGWVHLGLAADRPRRQALTAIKERRKTARQETVYKSGIVDLWEQGKTP